MLPFLALTSNPRLFLAIFPILFFCLLIFLRPTASLLKISAFILSITLIIAYLGWYLPTETVLSSFTRGFTTAFDIFLIIFGALLFLDILRHLGIISNLAHYLNIFSPDLRLQVIVLAWFLENFLEGIAGFGTPSTVVAPLLIALGLSPIKSVIIALLGNSTSVPFGAVGTPIRIGLANLNLDFLAIGSTTALYNFFGLLVPVFMLWVLLSSLPNRRQLLLPALPFAIWSGIAFTLPAYLISFLGVEFPSIIGSIVGITLVTLTTRFGLFVPAHPYQLQHTRLTVVPSLSLVQVLFPYSLFVIILILSKISPGLIFILTSLIVTLIYHFGWSKLFTTAISALKQSINPFLVIALMSTMVQLMNNSANQSLGLSSITQTFSQVFNTRFLPYLSPFIGAFGSFITGSATVSNLMFASPLLLSSLTLGLNHTNVLSLALAGAGAGNMIALADVLVAKTVAHDQSHLKDTILTLLPYCLIYLTLISIATFLVPFH